MKIAVPALLMLFGTHLPGIADTNVIAVGDWSKPTSDHGYKLRGRLLMCETPRHRGTGPGFDTALYLEIQECSDFIGPTMEVYCNMRGDVKLAPDFQKTEKAGGQWKVEDVSGRPLAESAAAYSGADVSAYWMQIPCDSTVRLRCSNWGSGRSEDGNLCIFLQTHCWVIPPHSTNQYFMSGTFTVDPPEDHVASSGHHVWRGSLTIPKMKIPAAKP